MYKTTRNVSGGTGMTCKDCGHSMRTNEICEKPLQAATDMLKHMAAHNASRAFATAERVIGAEPVPAVAPAVPPSASQIERQEQPDQTHVLTSLAPTEISRVEEQAN